MTCHHHLHVSPCTMTEPTPTHAHHHHHDFAEANKAFFDQHAHELHRPDALKLRQKTVAAIQRAHPALFDEDRTEVLDYACGVGAFTSYG